MESKVEFYGEIRVDSKVPHKNPSRQNNTSGRKFIQASYHEISLKPSIAEIDSMLKNVAPF